MATVGRRFMTAVCVLLAFAVGILPVLAVHGASSGGQLDIRIRTGCYIDSEGYFRGVAEKVTIQEFLGYFTDGQDIFVDKVATGGTVTKTFQGAVSHRATLIIKGDINGDGRVTSADYTILKKYFSGTSVLEGVGKEAADVDENGRLSSTDYQRIKKYFMGVYNLYPAPDITVYDPESSAVMYQIGLADDSNMMSYFIVTRAGKIIVIDGGVEGGNEFYGYLYAHLKKYASLTERKNVIDAWIFTHPHADHIRAFYKMWESHPEVQIQNFYFDFPTKEYIEAMPAYEQVYIKDLTEFQRVFNKNMGSSDAYDRYPRAKAGDRFIIDGIQFDILKNMHLEEGSVYDNINDCSMVFRMTVGGQTVLFLGDLNRKGGQELLSAYGADLKSDIVQMVHHGQNGVDENVYQAISPKVCLWPTPLWVWENKSGSLQTDAVKGWMQKLGVRCHLNARLGWLDENYESMGLDDKLTIALPSSFVVQ